MVIEDTSDICRKDNIPYYNKNKEEKQRFEKEEDKYLAW